MSILEAIPTGRIASNMASRKQRLASLQDGDTGVMIQVVWSGDLWSKATNHEMWYVRLQLRDITTIRCISFGNAICNLYMCNNVHRIILIDL